MRQQRKYSRVQQKATIKLVEDIFSTYFKNKLLQLKVQETLIIRFFIPVAEYCKGKWDSSLALEKIVEKIKSDGCETSYDYQRDGEGYRFVVKRVMITTLF